MKYLLLLSILFNIWFQFHDEIFYAYVSYKYCNGTDAIGMQTSEYSIGDFTPLHIRYVVEPYKDDEGKYYSTIECEDGTTNIPKESK